MTCGDIVDKELSNYKPFNFIDGEIEISEDVRYTVPGPISIRLSSKLVGWVLLSPKGWIIKEVGPYNQLGYFNGPLDASKYFSEVYMHVQM